MRNIVFDLKNVKCSYNGNKPVLEVDSLQIARGKMTILLGVSGAGKSTLLETLGLMNNTILPGSEIVFHSKNEDFIFNNIWQKSENVLSAIRNDHFSFIFQNTNLMPNFTAYENVAVTQLLQGASMQKSMDKVRHYMDLMGLSEVSLLKKTYELAGGQKQRLAFVRAITPEFDVLFADEPTGNLDRKNAREVMNLLKTEVTGKNKSAIIVTHDIVLAEEFADQIIIIDKQNGVGQINHKNVFNKESEELGWTNHQGEKINIKNLFSNILETS